MRDVKGLYKKARVSEKKYIGIDSPYKAPEKPEIVIETGKFSIEETIQSVLKFLASHTKLRA